MVGRKPINDKPLTKAQRDKRSAVKSSIFNKCMKDYGYIPCKVYLHPEHIKALLLMEYEYGLAKDSTRNSRVISQSIWRCIDHLLIASKKDGLPILNDELVHKLMDGGNWPQYPMHESAWYKAFAKFNIWEQEQKEQTDDKQ